MVKEPPGVPERGAEDVAARWTEERRRDDRFALAFAAEADRPALQAILDLHRRLSAVSPHPEEPHIPLIRLAWWRDTLASLENEPRPGEPLIEAISAHVPAAAFPALAALADAHMDRVEGEGGASVNEAVLAAAGAALGGVAPRASGRRLPAQLRPVAAALRAETLAHRSPTRRQLAMIGVIWTGRRP
ncbi:MAG: hypothetical protein V2J26_11030 [Pacificimonas sp.]|nr:hypothetical protein [Pacificimonas sp.]